MKDLEANKVAAAILLAGVIAMITGKVADILYHPVTPEKRGFEIEVVDASSVVAEPVEEKPIDIPALMAAASAEVGAKTFKKCAACHKIGSGDGHGVGPKLYGIVGAKIAGHGDYSYSSALQAINKKWDYQELFAFLKKPKEYAPGTKMSFAGLKKPEDIANLIAYLRENAGTKVPLP